MGVDTLEELGMNGLGEIDEPAFSGLAAARELRGQVVVPGLVVPDRHQRLP